MRVENLLKGLTYHFDEPSGLYSKIKDYPFYSIPHDGISKFGDEVSGVYHRVCWFWKQDILFTFLFAQNERRS